MSRVNVAVGVVRDSAGRVLIAKRKEDAHQGGLWEFPGGKIEQGESPGQALSRELLEELNIIPNGSSPLIEVNYSYPDVDVKLHVREVSGFSGEAFGCEGQDFRWVAADKLSDYSFPAANEPILTAIKLGREYAIIGGSSAQQVLAELDNVAKQGVGLVQIRAKSLSEQDAMQLRHLLIDKCAELNINYLLNSQMSLIRTSTAGLHLTSFDLMRIDKRPDGAGFVAASCHNQQELNRAVQLSLDFAVLSPVMQTSSHPVAKPLGWQKFQEYVAQVNIPVFALGGIGKHDFEQAKANGAQGISGISLYTRRSGL